MRLTRFEWGCVAVAAAAFVVRLTFLLEPTFIWDSAWFLLLARSFGETGTFYIPWSEPGEPQYSGYWPPLYPVFVSPFVKLLGPSFETLVVASIASALLLTVATYFTTRDLFDRTRAFAAMALVAASPAFYVSDAKGMSESLLALMVLLTVWAFVRSLDKPIWLPVAGLFAFLAYLGKASLGLPFVAAGILALAAWRVYTRGWRRVVTSPMDMSVAALALGLGLFLAFTRTERVGGVGLGLIEPISRAVFGAECSRFLPFGGTGPHCWAMLIPLKVLFVAAFLFVVTLPFSLRLREALRAKRTERTDALWLAALLPLVAGAVFTTTFFFTERRPFADFDNIRYLTPSIIPFLWLMIPHWPAPAEPEPGTVRDERVRRHHENWYWLAVGVMVALLLFNPLTSTETFGRFVAFLVLSIVPLTLALFARNSNYALHERRVPGGVELRYVRAPPATGDRRIALVAAAILLIGGWYFSSWYATVAVGLVVALSTPSPRRRVIAMSLVLLASAAASNYTAIPLDEAADVLATMPEGTIVGMSEIIVYSAAVAPDNIQPRLVYPEEPIPPDVDVLMMQLGYGEGEYEGFTKIASIEYRFHFSPTLQARIWFEENVLGQIFEFRDQLGVTLYVRDGSGLERYAPS